MFCILLPVLIDVFIIHFLCVKLGLFLDNEAIQLQSVSSDFQNKIEQEKNYSSIGKSQCFQTPIINKTKETEFQQKKLNNDL
jgi:hypothetical protein